MEQQSSKDSQRLDLDENEDLILRVRDYLERIIFARNYAAIFNRIAITCEEKDLSIQNRITSLHWITAPMLDTVLNEELPAAREAIYKAMNGKAHLLRLLLTDIIDERSLSSA